MHSLIDVDGEEIKKPNRINKNVVKNTRIKKFVDVSFNKKMMRNCISSGDYEILGWCPAGPVLPHGEKVPL